MRQSNWKTVRISNPTAPAPNVMALMARSTGFRMVMLWGSVWSEYRVSRSCTRLPSKSF